MFALRTQNVYLYTFGAEVSRLKTIIFIDGYYHTYVNNTRK